MRLRCSMVSDVIIRNTDVIGSSDGGKTVHASNPELNKIMEDSGKFLGLKPHVCGFTSPTTIVGPTDIEVHQANDGYYYVIDTARWYARNFIENSSFPPEAPYFVYNALIIFPDQQTYSEIELSMTMTLESQVASILKCSENKVVRTPVVLGTVFHAKGDLGSRGNSRATFLAGETIRGNAIFIFEA
jgi:hypothetical protein